MRPLVTTTKRLGGKIKRRENMIKQYKQNENLSQRNPYEIRARENNPKTRTYLDRRVNSLIAGKSLICAWYLLEYVVDTYPEICKHFGQIVELLGLPGCQSLIDDWLDHLSGEKNIGIPEDIKNKYSENVDLIKYTAAIDTFILDSFNRRFLRMLNRLKSLWLILSMSRCWGSILRLSIQLLPAGKQSSFC
jgi:hypothetical protein